MRSIRTRKQSRNCCEAQPRNQVLLIVQLKQVQNDPVEVVSIDKSDKESVGDNSNDPGMTAQFSQLAKEQAKLRELIKTEKEQMVTLSNFQAHLDDKQRKLQDRTNELNDFNEEAQERMREVLERERKLEVKEEKMIRQSKVIKEMLTELRLHQAAKNEENLSAKLPTASGTDKRFNF